MTSFISSWIAIFLTNQFLDFLPVGKAYFADTPIHGLTYGEFFATLVIIFSFAYGIGMLHGFLFGAGYPAMLALAAAAPLFMMMLAIAAATLGMGLIAFPIVVAYGAIVAYAAKQGSMRTPDHHQRSAPR